MNCKHRSAEKELLDGDNIPFEDIKTNMEELNTINKWLGGHFITCKGVAWFLNKAPKEQPLAIAETGCGGGDNLVVIQTFMGRLGRATTLTGIDLKQECIAFAQQNRPDNIVWICSDYRAVTWPAVKPDIVFSSLFCHHFTNEQLVAQLKWLQANSKLGFFINDLQRHWLAYSSIKIITRLWSRSYLVKNDAPLSVLRGFTKKEWIALMEQAGITNYTIKWQWAFRYLICVDNEQ